jgi:hypothetical protein
MTGVNGKSFCADPSLPMAETSVASTLGFLSGTSICAEANVQKRHTSKSIKMGDCIKNVSIESQAFSIWIAAETQRLVVVSFHYALLQADTKGEASV